MEDVDMFSEMRNCMSRMPWGELHGIGDGYDLSWFKSEARDGDGSHSLGIAASRAPEIRPLASPSVSFLHITLPQSSHQHQTNLDSGRILHTSQPKDITVNVNSSVNIGSQEEEGVPPDDAMDIDEEDSATNPQPSSKKTLKGIRGANVVPLPQIHKLRLRGSRPKPSLKGKKRAMVEDEEEREDNDEDDDDDEVDNEEEEERVEEEEKMVCSPTQTHS